MSLPVFLRPEAQADLLAARNWYERHRAGLGDEFADAVGQLLERIELLPELYPATHRIVRRGKVRRFPYVVYYRVQPSRVEVIAILHGSRNPQIWQERT
jgi:plasmid stabilization system protein ParE